VFSPKYTVYDIGHKEEFPALVTRELKVEQLYTHSRYERVALRALESTVSRRKGNPFG
jgi:hypothetical protein